MKKSSIYYRIFRVQWLAYYRSSHFHYRWCNDNENPDRVFQQYLSKKAFNYSNVGSKYQCIREWRSTRTNITMITMIAERKKTPCVGSFSTISFWWNFLQSNDRRIFLLQSVRLIWQFHQFCDSDFDVHRNGNLSLKYNLLRRASAI